MIKTPICDFVKSYISEDRVRFHMPGHKGDRLFRRFGYDDFLDNIAGCDITEIPGADNLFQAESIITRITNKIPRTIATFLTISDTVIKIVFCSGSYVYDSSPVSVIIFANSNWRFET